MSRTYRFKKSKDAYRIKDSWILSEYVFEICSDGKFEWKHWFDRRINPKSKEGKKRLAQFHSDSKNKVMLWDGPSWFHRLFAQKPYRQRAHTELYKFVRNEDHEVIIESKPYRKYWY